MLPLQSHQIHRQVPVSLLRGAVLQHHAVAPPFWNTSALREALSVEAVLGDTLVFLVAACQLCVDVPAEALLVAAHTLPRAHSFTCVSKRFRWSQHAQSKGILFIVGNDGITVVSRFEKGVPHPLCACMPKITGKNPRGKCRRPVLQDPMYIPSHLWSTSG